MKPDEVEGVIERWISEFVTENVGTKWGIGCMLVIPLMAAGSVCGYVLPRIVPNLPIFQTSGYSYS